jgi:GntR family transcriptional regulator/MocR family aminotransferase
LKADDPRPGADAATLTVAVDRGATDPAYVQLYGQVRDLILAGRLVPGARLPSSRALAAEIGVSRTTIVAAYDHLQSEGYLDGRGGSGMYVTATLPERLLTRDPLPNRVPAPAAPAGNDGLRGLPFDPGAPDATAFPAAAWARLLARGWRQSDPSLLHDRSDGGLPSLRRAIADHMRAMRGIECDPAQVVVTAGAGDAIALLAAALPVAGARIWVEDPGYMTLRRAFTAAGATVSPVAVDGEGFDTASATRTVPGARVAVVTPSRQYPLGTTMSLGRRLALLAWARDADGWIVEDDYDSEYRYAGRPLAALMGLDDDGRVIYVGSFSKVMFRALRLGYIIAPPALAPRLLAARRQLGSQASIVAQPALAAFVDSGRFAAHIRDSSRPRPRTAACIWLRSQPRPSPAISTTSRHRAGPRRRVSSPRRCRRTTPSARAARACCSVSPAPTPRRCGRRRAGSPACLAGSDGPPFSKGLFWP